MEKQIYMTPKQPFFVTSSRSYEKLILNRFGIVHFYHCFTGTEPRYAIPDGCVDMVFCCDPNHPFSACVSCRGIIRFWAVRILWRIWSTTAFRWMI